ncbi:MAG: hypothetical protein OXG64_07690 [Chloroflexi bacterium]|nr:hypothetical protein [Chloroflexota bacterium]
MSSARVDFVDLRRALTRDRDVSRQLVVALLGALGAAAAGAAVALAVGALPEGLAAPLLALALSALALAPAGHALIRRGDLFQPIVLIGFFFFLDFGMRTLLVEAGSELAEPFVFVNIDDARAPAIALAMLALGLIYLGYYAPWWRRAVGRLPQVSLSVPAKAPWMVLGLVYTVGVIARAVLLLDRGATFASLDLQNRLTDDFNLLLQAGSFSQFAALLAGVYAFRRSQVRTGVLAAVLAVIAPIEMAFTVAFGAKHVFAFQMVALAGLYNYRVRRLGGLGFAAAVAAVVVVMFGVVTIYRDRIHQGALERPSDAASLVTAPAALAGELLAGGPGEFVQAALRTLANRHTAGETVASILAYGDSVDLEVTGADLALIPAYAFVPRAVWPDKPTPFSPKVSSAFRGVEGNRTSFGITHTGDLYLRHGLPGVVIGSLAMGLLYRLIYGWLVDRTGAGAVGAVLYLALFWRIVFVNAEIIPVYVQAIRSLVVGLGLLVLITFAAQLAGGARAQRGL